MSNIHEQTRGRLFRATIRTEDKYDHLSGFLRVGKRAHTTNEGGATVMHWSFLTPAQDAELRGWAVTEEEPAYTALADLVSSVQALG